MKKDKRKNSHGLFNFAQATIPLLLEAVDASPHPPTLVVTGATASMRGGVKFADFAAGKFAGTSVVTFLSFLPPPPPLERRQIKMRLTRRDRTQLELSHRASRASLGPRACTSRTPSSTASSTSRAWPSSSRKSTAAPRMA